MEMREVDGSPPRPDRRGRRDDGVAASDAVLMQRIAGADRSAMQVLFSRYHLAVFRFVLQRVQNRTLAEDVTSEVFLDVWRHAGRFDGRSAVSTWILALARHKTVASGPQPRPRLAADAAARDPGPPPQARDRHAVLRQCMRRLPAEHREVIDLVYCQEQSVDAVAAILGIPRSIAKTRVFYARRRLADELKKAGMEWVAV